MSAPHKTSVEGTFEPLNTDVGQVGVVRDEDSPSRQTMFLDAPGMSADERSTHWLTADVDDFCDLNAMI